jgi:hypothetical protein
VYKRAALVSRVACLHLTHQDDRLRWGNEELLLRRYADDVPALRTQLVQLLLDVLAVSMTLYSYRFITQHLQDQTRFGTLPVMVKSRRIAL